MKPKLRVLVDRREQSPYFSLGSCEVQQATLLTGDYSLPEHQNNVAIERKAPSDLVGCVTWERDRFVRELERSRSLQFFAIVAETSVDSILEGKYWGKCHPNSVLQTIVSWCVKYGVPIWLAGSRQHGQLITFSLLEKWQKYFAEEEEARKNH